ncbi:MAG: cupin domain-containing protein [Planctomycetota bacterium]|jgi:transcriptional regulator with XRE-family HTH domain|nr:cupin domain-containing protein [Planctomycetota bacterium]
MRENARDIGQRIKGLREDMGVSATEMAGILRVSPEQYARYESAAEDITASELSEIATRLNVDLGLFLTGETPRMSLFAVTRAGTGPGVDRRKGYKYENLAASFKGAKFEPFVVSLPEAAPDAPVPQNVHIGQEFNYMLQGRMLLKIQDNEFELGPGDSVIFDASKPHGMKAVSGAVKFLAIITV